MSTVTCRPGFLTAVPRYGRRIACEQWSRDGVPFAYVPEPAGGWRPPFPHEVAVVEPGPVAHAMLPLQWYPDPLGVVEEWPQFTGRAAPDHTPGAFRPRDARVAR